MIILLLVRACSPSGPAEEETFSMDPFQRLLEEGEVTGSLQPFDLVEHPTYLPVHSVDFIQDDEWVLLSRACGFVLAFPHRSMYVEVVNEAAHGTLMAMSYCPITRSGIAFNRVQGEDTLLLTASGYLFRENMVPMDLHGGSLWSQMQMKGMEGANVSEQLGTFPLVETSWRTVREHLPEAGVFVPEGNFKSGSGKPLEGQLPYDQVYGILGRDRVELFRLDMFPGEMTLRTTTVRPGGRVVVAGSSRYRFMVSFLTDYSMEAMEDRFPVIMKDETGTLWNVFGEAVEGERGGETLPVPVAYSAADWAWKDHFDGIIYHDPEPPPGSR